MSNEPVNEVPAGPYERPRTDENGVCRGCGVKCQPKDDEEDWDYCECPASWEKNEDYFS